VISNIVSNIKTNCTYTDSENYWAPLIEDDEDVDEDTEEDEVRDQTSMTIQTINNINDTGVQQDLKTILRKWINECMNIHKPFHKRESTMVIDSGATSSFVRPEENLPVTGFSSKIVHLPDGSSIQATHTTLLPFKSLSPKARIADVLPGLRPNSLVSVGKLADANYTTIFHPHGIGVTVHDDTLRTNSLSTPVLQGWRDTNGLWRLSTDEEKGTLSTQKTKEVAANVYTLPSIKQAIRYLHAAAGFPTKDTWIKAITNGNYITWPRLTVEMVRRHYPDSVETLKGHLKKQRQNVRSTKKKISDDVLFEDCELTRTITKHDILVKVINASETVYTDQTGRLPIQSNRGNTSLMIYYDVDANYIDAEPLRNHADSQMISAYRNLWERTNRGRETKPKLHILDNEASEAFKSAIKENCDLQLVPPDTHRRNLAERAIQTFKSHFISILAGVDPSFPMSLWDRLIPQAVMTLNLLRNSHKTPTISAYQHVNGIFDYNKLPLAPLGCLVEIHESTNRRRTWDPRSLTGWYLGTSTEHYRCHKIFCKKTRSERISDTVIFRHSYLTQPIISPDDHIVKAIGDLSSALRQRINARGKEEMEVLSKMNAILSNTSHENSDIKKKVTFKDPIPASKVGPCVSTFRQNRRPASSPRVIATAIVDKPLLGVVNKPTTRSKYARALADSVSQRTRSSHRYPTRGALTITELAGAMLHDTTSESALQYANEIFDEDSGQMLKYRKLITHPKHCDVWLHSSANEFGRLAQGVGNRIQGTDTIFFIHKHQIPEDRFKDVTYAKFVCELKPNKAEVHRTRLTVGGDKVHYPGDVGTPTADLTLVKMHVNSVISTHQARYMTLDVKNFYLNTPMVRYEYVRIKIDDVPEEIIIEYKLREKVASDGHVYVEIRKGMYGLPQAGILAQELLEKRLNEHGYSQSCAVPGLWTHTTRPISFTLVVDDFGVKYVGKENATHLISILKQYYEISEDWTGSKYIGITFDWDYQHKQVHLSMPGYIDKALQRFDHTRPQRSQNSPHQHVIPTYGARAQYAEPDIPAGPLLDKDGKKYIQAVIGTLLYYSRAVDPTMLVALNAIATQQASPTQKTMEQVKQLLDYCASQEEAVITYRASDMVLAIHSDAGYLNESKARSRAGGHFFLSYDVQNPPNNGAVLTIAQIIDAVMSSAAEAELGALFINAKAAVHMRRILQEMGHPQPRTPIQTDNSTAEGVINSRVRPKRTKSMDMRFEWLLDREQQGQFKIYWRPGKTNLADYFTKHHPPSHHRNMRGEFLTRVAELLRLRAQNSNKEAGLATTDHRILPQFSARVY
jgi:hypothetical protein